MIICLLFDFCVCPNWNMKAVCFVNSIHSFEPMRVLLNDKLEQKFLVFLECDALKREENGAA